ncbi:MAG: hypothetical protein QOE38_1924, partial [Thermoleophilaceae bacterium]|nr:hypothetical protein [Thermoleophilaceae bacterium]
SDEHEDAIDHLPPVAEGRRHETAYQSPGGVWSVDAAAGEALIQGLQLGMSLASQHRQLLQQRERSGDAAATLASMLQHGLLYEGCCPRCGHDMHTRVTFGVLVEDVYEETGPGGQEQDQVIRWRCGSKEPFRRLGRVRLGHEPEADQLVKRVTFVCSCGEPHPGRPDSAVFAGCGAVWSQPALAAGTEIELNPGTPEEALWAEEARALSQRPLDRIRAQANQWRTASASFTAVLAAATLIGVPQAGSKPVYLSFVLAVLGFLVLLFATGLSVFAASTVSGYDHRLLNAIVLPAYERERGATALRQIQTSMISMLFGVLLIAAAGAVAYLKASS